MTTYYIQDNEQIVLWDEDKTRLENTLICKPELKDLPILETEDLIVNGEIVTHEQWEQEQIEKELQRIANLEISTKQFEIDLYKSRFITFDIILEKLGKTQLDMAPLKIALSSPTIKRDNIYVEIIGNIWNIPTEKLDQYFDTLDYNKLILVSETKLLSENEEEIDNNIEKSE